jgi:hypothetical protein
VNRLFPLAVLMLALVPAAASAHGVGVEAKLKGDTVRVEGYFDDDTPAADAKVAVTDTAGTVIAEGKADKKGAWSFPVPPAGKYTVTLDAGEGHLAKTTVTIPPRPAPPPTVTGEKPPEASPVEQEVVVSDGLTRAETTGVRRLWMAALGVGVIALLTGGGWFLAQRRNRRTAEGVPSREV